MYVAPITNDRHSKSVKASSDLCEDHQTKRRHTTAERKLAKFPARHRVICHTNVANHLNYVPSPYPPQIPMA